MQLISNSTLIKVSEEAVISCDEGHELTSGSAVRKCDISGDLSGDVPVCTGKCLQLFFLFIYFYYLTYKKNICTHSFHSIVQQCDIINSLLNVRVKFVVCSSFNRWMKLKTLTHYKEKQS